MLKFSANDSDYLPILESLIGLPWWSTGPESICQGKGHRFYPCFRKISHSTGQLSLCPTTMNPSSATREATAMRSRKVVSTLHQLEKAHVQQQRRDTAKSK